MMFLATLGSGIGGIIGKVGERAEGIISTLINLFRQILDYIYSFMLKFWSFVMDNPKGAVTFFANLWVLML